MPILTRPSLEARTAIAFITAGSLIDVWCATWYVYLRNHEGASIAPYYWCAGFFFSGLVLITIGLGLGRIGRAARQAELPPPEATPTVAEVDKEAASRAPMIAPVNPSQPAPNASVAPLTGVPRTDKAVIINKPAVHS